MVDLKGRWMAAATVVRSAAYLESYLVETKADVMVAWMAVD